MTSIILPDGVNIASLLRAPKNKKIIIEDFDARSTPGVKTGKKHAVKRIAGLAKPLSEMQERLWAAGRESDEANRVLVVLQGMDTSGKGGVVRHVFGLVDPQGIQLKAFKAPTPEELSHDFLWRIKKEIPRPGMIGIFDRSHYEDVLIVRVNELVPIDEWQKRYALINEFEEELAANGTTIIKCFLNVSYEKQRERLLERLSDPAKYWKYNPGDIDVRKKWSAYMQAYSDAITNCNTDFAPWYIIPADRKWYRNWAIARILYEHLRAQKLGWPKADFDVAEEIQRVKSS
ncbi:MAG: phosphate--nucleotide phosphotransferase [Propionibacterium sp.]|nr:MAG: phosphate--nucleotide phosphotransferase [Propionibacterium sp.]